MFSLIIKNEHYFCNNINDKLIEKDICFICWLPAEKNNIIKKLSDFSHINIICKCSPKIHQLCLSDWIITNASCPICRTKILYSNQKYLTFYHKFVKCNMFSIKLICYINLLYFIYIFCHNMYILTFFDDYTDIY